MSAAPSLLHSHSSSLHIYPSLSFSLSPPLPLLHVSPSYCAYCFCCSCKWHIVYLQNLRFFLRSLLCFCLSLSLVYFVSASLSLLIFLFAFWARLLRLCLPHNTTCHTSGVVQPRLRPYPPTPQPVAAFDLLPLIYLCAARHSQYFIFVHSLRLSFFLAALRPFSSAFIKKAQNHLTQTQTACCEQHTSPFRLCSLSQGAGKGGRGSQGL